MKMNKSLMIILLFVLSSFFFQEQVGMTQDQDEKKERELKLLEKVTHQLEEKDTYTIISELSENATPLETAGRFSNLIRFLYFQKKDISRMVLCGRIGIQYAISESRKDTGDSEKLLSFAKEMAYNTSTNCWPGWNDEGVTPNATDLAAGKDLALFNYRMALELKKDEDKVANALWLIGVHQLAGREYDQAASTFDQAAEKFKIADKKDFYWMAKGYLALAKKLSGDKEGENLEKEAFRELTQIGTDDSIYFVEQIQTAEKAFLK